MGGLARPSAQFPRDWQNHRISEVRQQVLIDAPPRAVWALITDVNRHPEWWPDVEEVHCDDFHEGCSYREVIKVPLGTAQREFVDAAAGMNPIGLRYKAFDAIAGSGYFRKWLDRSLAAMKQAAGSAT